MSSNRIYQPYTYLITFVPTNQVYYGVRYAKGCHPSDLFVSYFTPSKEIYKLIQEYGIEQFNISIRRTFTSAKAAIKWESKVLKRLNVSSNPNFINKCNGSAPSSSTEIRNLILKTFILKYGVDNPSKHPEVIQKILNFWKSLSNEEKEKINNKRYKTCLTKYGKTNVMQVDYIKKQAVLTNLQVYGVEYAGKQIVTCPWCNKSGGKMGFDVFHFNYCKENPNRITRDKKTYSCYYCGFQSVNKSNMDRYHFNNCKKSPNYVKPTKISYTCPHCMLVGYGKNNMKRYHFDNCKQKRKET